VSAVARALLLVSTVAVAAGCGAADHVRVPAATEGHAWREFGYEPSRGNASPFGITEEDVKKLQRVRVNLPGTADSSAIYLPRVNVKGERRDLFVLTTSYGRAIAVDAESASVVWTFTPRGLAGWAGTSQITHSSPVADPSGRFVYSASPDGFIHKLVSASGNEIRTGSWPARITRDPTHEKIGPALNYWDGTVLAATGGYIGDAPPYQGHVAVIEARTGRIRRVWNSLCSDRAGLLDPRRCPESGSAIWARSGVVVERATGRLLVATGDGRWNGSVYWGDSVLELARGAAGLRQNWTPRNQADLDSGDVDLGSTAPALLTSKLAIQSGKDGRLRLLDLTRLNGSRSAGRRTGGELQTLPTPSGGGLFSAPAVWREGGRVWTFVADDSATAAYRLVGRSLRRVWRRSAGGTSPVIARGLLYVYDTGGTLNVYRARSGVRVAALPAGSGHWNSPIVVRGVIALPVGDANDHRVAGTLELYVTR
jgi:hypothetical protein